MNLIQFTKDNGGRAVGAIDKGKEFTGNPDGGPAGKTPPITREALLARDYNEQDLPMTLSLNFEGLGRSMAEVIEDGTSHYTEEDLAALSNYLFSEK